MIGSTTSYPQLTRDCGEISNNVNSTGNTALISFTSDGSHTTRGFKYEITSIGGGKYIVTYTIKVIIKIIVHIRSATQLKLFSTSESK